MRFDKGKKEIQVNFARIRRCGGTFSLRAKSRLQRLRSDTRLRAQPRGEGLGLGAFPCGGRWPRPRPRPDEGRVYLCILPPYSL